MMRCVRTNPQTRMSDYKEGEMILDSHKSMVASFLGKSERLLMTLCLLMTLTPSVIFAQTEQSKSETLESVQSYAWALQFQINENFTLTSFEGSTLSLQYQPTPKQAIRLGLSLQLVEESEIFDPIVYGNSEGEDSDDAYTKSISLNVHYLRFHKPEHRIHVYYGAGPRVEYYNEKIDEWTSRRQKYKETLWSIGICGKIGAQWRITQQISLLAEYGVDVMYSSTKVSETGYRDDYEREFTKFNVSSDAVNFGVSVHF